VRQDGVICSGRTWLRKQERAWYGQGLHTLVHRWRNGRRSGRRLSGKIWYWVKPPVFI